MKFYKLFFYTLRPVMLLLFISCFRYLLGDNNAFLKERIIIYLVGGLILVVVWYLMDWYKTRKKITNWIISALDSQIEYKK